MKIARAACFVCLIFAGFPVFAQVSANICGPLANSDFGPYDFRPNKFKSDDMDSYTHKLWLVESAHFRPRVESLIGGNRDNSKEPPGGDIDYTLRAFPNHHRALMAVMNYGERKKSQQPAGLRYTVECYFERAIRFKPDDTIARMIYATYLTKNSRTPEAVSQLQISASFAADNAFTHYNIGLVYFDMKNYAKALVQAHAAMALGFERTELRDLLKRVNQWQDPKTEARADSTVQPASQSVSQPIGDAAPFEQKLKQ